MKFQDEDTQDLNFIISGIKERSLYIFQLKRELRENGLKGIEMIDPFPILRNAEARKRGVPNGPTRNFIRQIKYVKEFPEKFRTYILVIADDVYLHSDFGWHFRNIIDRMKEQKLKAVSLFVPPNAKWTKRSDKGEENFGAFPRFLWNPAVIYEKEFLIGFDDFQRENMFVNTDILIREYCKAQGVAIEVAMPSLVRHNVKIPSSLGTGASIGGNIRDTRCYDPNLAKNHFETYRNNEKKL